MDELNSPLITTIMPTYRRPKLLTRAIRSVLNQTYPHFKLCIYDNASGDETASVVEAFAKHDKRVHYHCHPENIGAAKNFLYGLQQVDTLFFNFLSDDDIILPHFFESAIHALTTAADASYFIGATIRADSEGKFLEVPVASWKKGIYYPPNGFIEMLRNGQPEWTAILFRTAILSRIHIDMEVSHMSDLDFQLQIAARYPIVVDPVPCAIFFLHPIINTPRARLSVEIPGMFKLIENFNTIEELPEPLKYEARSRIMKLIKRTAFHFGIRGALTGFHEETQYAHTIMVTHFPHPFQTNLLKILTNDSIIQHLLVIILNLLWKIRRLYRKKMPTKWESIYRNYQSYLKKISE